jgi:Zn-dependent peptidase ImmA (M78 family)/transcriptional regulator with XRE-family HTH domain
MPDTSERVRELISASGLSQRAFAEQVGLDTTKLSKSLTGSRRFSSLELARIADVSSVSVDWLITGSDPELTVAARSTGGSARVAVQAAERLSTVRDDMAHLGFPQPWRPVRWTRSSKSPAAQGAELARLAQARLTEQAVSTANDDLAGALETAFGVDVAVLDLGPTFDGLSVSSVTTKLILVGTSTVPARQRFTMAHELAHLLAGDDGQLHVDADIYAAEYRHDPIEQRANAFAAALLMPPEALRAAIQGGELTRASFATLTVELGVSPSSLAYRLQALRIIDASTCEHLRSITGMDAANLAGEGDTYPLRVAAANSVRQPGLLVRDTYAAYREGETTLRPYANLIGVDADKLRESLESGE